MLNKLIIDVIASSSEGKWRGRSDPKIASPHRTNPSQTPAFAEAATRRQACKDVTLFRVSLLKKTIFYCYLS